LICSSVDAHKRGTPRSQSRFKALLIIVVEQASRDLLSSIAALSGDAGTSDVESIKQAESVAERRQVAGNIGPDERGCPGSRKRLAVALSSTRQCSATEGFGSAKLSRSFDRWLPCWWILVGTKVLVRVSNT
jgi:hypothetical protein